MYTQKTIRPAAWVAVLLAGMCLGSVSHAQQPSATPSADQEFLDSIRKGNATRVAELLKQNPALIKAANKNGTTPVLLAVYARHPEIAESLLATGIEPNIFEAAATRRVDSR